MQFDDYEADLPAKGGSIRIRVTAEALQLLWGARSGPQTAGGLVERNMAMIEELVAMTPAGPDGLVTIRAIDIEG